MMCNDTTNRESYEKDRENVNERMSRKELNDDRMLSDILSEEFNLDRFKEKYSADDNVARVFRCILHGSEFFIVGKAGQEIESLVEIFAQQCDVRVITYDGPYTKDPLWGEEYAREISENPDQKYLLFFNHFPSEFSRDVFIELGHLAKHHCLGNNYFVGAACEYTEDVGKLLGASLASIFKPIIYWRGR